MYKCKDCGETFYKGTFKEIEEMKRGEIESFLYRVCPECESDNWCEVEEQEEEED